MAGGRFLQRDKYNNNCWIPVSSKLARMKVSHALRDKCTLDRPDEVHFIVKLRINDYSMRNKHTFIDELTCALLQIPLPIQDDNHCVESILRNEALSLLQKHTPTVDYKRIGLCKGSECVICMTPCDVASQPYHGFQDCELKREFNSLPTARNSCSDTSSDDIPIESLEYFNNFIHDEEDVSSICLSSIPLKNDPNLCNADKLLFPSCRENVEEN